jgi:hypothetical protein
MKAIDPFSAWVLGITSAFIIYYFVACVLFVWIKHRLNKQESLTNPFLVRLKHHLR